MGRDFHLNGYEGSGIPLTLPETFPTLAMSGRTFLMGA